MARTIEFTAEQEARLAGPESHNNLAAAFGVSTAPIRRWRLAHDWSPTPLTVEAADPSEGPSELDLARDEARQLRAQLRKGAKASVADERVLRSIEGALERVEPLLLPRVDLAGLVGHSDPAPHHRQAALWSDWHYGEVVDYGQMNGINSFNVHIAEERVAQLVLSTLKFQRVRPALTGLDIWLLGDMASGSIHNLEETNELPAAEQYVKVGYLIASAVRQLAPHYPEISLAAVVGNHPRPGKEPASKDAYNNGDWIAYKLAEALTRDLPNVSWEIPPGGMIVREFAGKNFLLWHGDGVRSSMPGVPWGGVVRRVNVLKDTYAAMGVRIDYVVAGHFHQRAIVPNVYMNGSLVGPNEYGVKNFGGGEAPKQLLLTFDEKRSRETDVSTISFEDV